MKAEQDVSETRRRLHPADLSLCSIVQTYLSFKYRHVGIHVRDQKLDLNVESYAQPTKRRYIE
jgi:hypothetical protein